MFQSIIFICISLRGSNGGDEQFADFTAFSKHIPILVFGYYMRVLKQSKPIIRFVTFLKCNLKFVDKVCFARRIICLVNICANACSTAQNLI